MTFKNFLAASTIICGTMLGAGAFAATEAVTDNAREMATNFVNVINEARYMIATKDIETAKVALENAKDQAGELAQMTVTDKKVSGVQYGRVAYDVSASDNNKNNEDDYYFYPVQTGKVSVRKVGSGPFWSGHKGLAVKDAEVLYVTVDLTHAEVQKKLDAALQDLDNNKPAQAEETLEDLIEDVVSVDKSNEALAVKARDNLELARNYLQAKNYDAARYPLKHAKSALKSMEGDKRYTAEQPQVKRYLSDIGGYEKIIAKKDPTAIEKMQQDWSAMWTDLKTWSERKFD